MLDLWGAWVEPRRSPGRLPRTLARLPPPLHGASGGEIASFWESFEASQASKDSQKLAISPPLAPWGWGQPCKGLREPSRTFAMLPPPLRRSSSGEIASFWESFEAWEASEESQKLAILPPLTPGGQGESLKGPGTHPRTL